MNLREDQITAQMGKDGMVLTPASAADIKLATETMRPYWAEWAKAHGPEALEVMAKLRAMTGR